MARWHHRCNGHEFEQILGDGEGQGGLSCCSSWGHREFDMARLTGQQQQLPFNSFSHKRGALVKSSLVRAFGFRLSQADRIS